MKNKTRIYIVLAVILAAFCAISFLVPFERNGVFYIAFAFGVLAILIQLYTFPKAFFHGKSAKSKFYGFPLERLTVVYLIVQLVLSFLFMGLAVLNVPAWIAVLVFVLLLVVNVIGFFSAEAMRDEIERQDVKLKKDTSAMRSLRSKVENLAINAPADCKIALDRLSEAFRYSDPVSSDELAEVERELAGRIDDLQQAVTEGDSAGILTLCHKANLTLAERNRLCKLNK